ncbi:serine/threonine protein kinase [Nocardiopsis sp. Huas11]|uniref:WD40 repeat domain-containing serine/threonine protein kinase n=1 Tax=Nocardiopsis sp. Huas11 TaxID=2183912 RepID=UPI000EB1C7B6|nr:serine/threonine-protein kinase [Nocardiopsis sp. Huas11]RKS06266.1 serine/threonine protein kinase [Nocardiopsis sp. Huas11]
MQPLASDDPQSIGPHRLLARLGAGGMGKVYLARTPDGHLCALKAVKEDLAHDAQFRARFAREIRAAQRVRGPFTPAVVDADPDAPEPWMATEYVPGPTLKEAVRDGGPFPEPSLLVLTLGLARALATIHGAGLMHRDLKPSNILLSPRGPQVIDFGIARAVEGTVLTRTGQTFGTPAYSSPEQVVGQNISPRSDLFSMAGAVVFAAGGEPPFGAGPPARVLRRVMSGRPNLDAVPEGVLRDLLARCFAKDPAHRPGAEEVRAALADLPLPSAEHGWLPAPVTEQIDRHAGRTRRAEEADLTTADMSGADGFGTGSTPVWPSTTVPGEATAPGGDTVPGSAAPRPWWRRRTAVVTASAAAALVIAGGGALALTTLPLGSAGEPGAGGEPSADPAADPSGAPQGGEGEEGLSVDLGGFTFDLGFSADGETLYVYGSELSAWDWREGVPVDVFEPSPLGAAIGRDGLIVASYVDHVRVWGGDSGNITAHFGSAHENDDRGYYQTPAISDDGAKVAATTAEDGHPGNDHVLQVWDVESETPEVEIPLEGVLYALEFTADGSLLVGRESASDSNDDLGVSVWDAATGERLHRFPEGYGRHFDLSPEDRTMVMSAAGGEGAGPRDYELVDLDTGEPTVPLAALDEDHAPVAGVYFSADGDRVYAATDGGAASAGSVWDARTGELVVESEPLLHEPLAEQDDGEHLATMTSDSRILILDSGFGVVTELN